MPSFGKRSQSRLVTCHADLVRLFQRVVQTRDCTVLCGVRTREEQDEAFESGHSKVRWPHSKHNVREEGALSRAIDVAPWHPRAPHVRWNDIRGFDVFAGYVMGVADELGVQIRWGGDWDGDHDVQDQTFNDLVHFELRG